MTWTIVGLATCGIVFRPWRLPEAIWAVAGALLLIITGWLPPLLAWRGIAKGTDVYLFLAGMMLLAEIARAEGLFDWLAAHAARAAAGSASRLFDLCYLVGTVVTIFLSNDATAVVLTPAIAAVAKTVGAKQPLPYLFVCAFVANAASFVLPISNPANLVIYGSQMPPLMQWLPRYALPSLLSIGATYLVLRLTQRRALTQSIEREIDPARLTTAGWTAALGLVAAAIALMVTSALGLPLGVPTSIAGAATAVAVLVQVRKSPSSLIRNISWNVLPLVAGLFVMVEALDHIGAILMLEAHLRAGAAVSASRAGWAAGVGLALISNIVNNLPAGLIAGTAIQAAHAPDVVNGSALIGIDLGPNLSVTGSLATILWLTALRREGQEISAWSFFKLGALVMPPALILALGGLMLSDRF